MTSESGERELPVVRPSERRYRTLQKWAKKGVLLIEPKDNGRPLVVTVTELASFTVDEAKCRPHKVRARRLQLDWANHKPRRLLLVACHSPVPTGRILPCLLPVPLLDQTSDNAGSVRSKRRKRAVKQTAAIDAGLKGRR